MSGRDDRPWGSLTRGEQIALLLRLGILVALAVTLVRAFLAFQDLCQAQNLPLGRVFYIPAALVAGFALTALSLWRMGMRFLGGGGAREEKVGPGDDQEPGKQS